MGSELSLPAPHRFTVEEYHRMGEAGIFTEDDRVELIAGEIVEMAPIGTDHASVVARLDWLFNQKAVGKVLVWPHGNPIILSDEDEPQPDLTLVKPRSDFYRHAHPRPQDVVLVVEVADTSFAFDRGKKLGRYALAGVSEVWIVDLRRDELLVFRDPQGRDYALERVVRSGERVSPLALPELAIGPLDLGGESGS